MRSPLASTYRFRLKTALVYGLSGVLLASGLSAISVVGTADVAVANGAPQACTVVFPSYDGDINDSNVSDRLSEASSGVFAISSAEDLVWLSWASSSANTNSTLNAAARAASYRQTVDIDLRECDWTPIGTNTLTGNFTGTYDGAYSGGNHSVNNLTVITTSERASGLFGWIVDATLQNLNLTNVDISVTGQFDYAGGAVGSATGTLSEIENVHVLSGTVSSPSGQKVGGLVGQHDDGSITESSSSASVEGYEAGGLVGNNGGTIELSWASGDVTGPEGYMGGLVGRDSGVISDSYATGSVTGDITDGDVSRVGGLVGRANSTISRSYATGAVSGYSEVGGLVGQFDDGTIIYSFASGAVEGNQDVGGLIGETSDDGPLISNSFASGSVTGDHSLGGLIGDADEEITVVNSYSTGLVTVNPGADGGDDGGLIGKERPTTVTNSFWDTETSGFSTSLGGVGKTTAEMTTLSTFTAASWAIISTSALGGPSGPTTEIWGIGSGVNCGYPFLWWQTVSGVSCESEGGVSGTSESSAGVPGIFLYVAGPVGRTVGHSPVYYGADRVAAASEYEVRVLSTSTRNPMVVSLGSGELPINGSLPSTMVRLPQLEPGTYLVRMTGKHTTGKTLELTAQITVGPNGTFTGIGPNIPIIR